MLGRDKGFVSQTKEIQKKQKNLIEEAKKAETAQKKPQKIAEEKEGKKAERERTCHFEISLCGLVIRLVIPLNETSGAVRKMVAKAFGIKGKQAKANGFGGDFRPPTQNPLRHWQLHPLQHQCYHP